MQNKLRLKFIISFSLVFMVCLCSFFLSNRMAEAKDNEQITIIIQTGYDEKNLPSGVAGYTYPIFDFTATDVLGNNITDTSVSVFYDVNSDSKFDEFSDDVLVMVENDRFYTENQGTYVIEYIANKGTNVEVKRIFVEVVDEADYIKPRYVINDNIVSESFTGSKVYLPDGILIAMGNFGKVEEKLEIAYSGDYDCEEVEIVAFDARKKYFTTQVSGEYTVKYILTDILGADEASVYEKTVVVNDSDKPVIIAPSISGVFIINEEAKLPYVEAIQYRDGKIVYVPVSATFNGVSVGDDMCFTPTESGNFELVFTAKNVFGGENATLTYNVVVNQPVDETPYIDRLMKLDGFEGFYRTSNQEGLEDEVYILKADGSKDKAEMSFKNKIAVQFLHFGVGADFNEVVNYNNYDYLEYVLTDSVNSREQLTIGIKKGTGGVAQLYVNGYYEKDFTTGNFEPAYDKIEFKYDFENKKIVDGFDVLLADIKSYADGSEFLGFSSGYAYVKFSMNGITDKSQVKFSMLASFYVSGDETERTKPKIVFENSVTSVIAYTTDINQTVRLKKYGAFDVYDENVDTYLTIYSPEGKIALQTLMESDIDFKVVQYGNYLLQYKFVDQSGRSRTTDGMIQVIDRVAPTVKKLPVFSGAIKKGATYNFPKVEFEDNCTEQKNITVFVYLIYGNYQKVLAKYSKDDNLSFSYNFTEAGTYTVRYCAVDAAGNRTVVSYDILCN